MANAKEMDRESQRTREREREKERERAFSRQLSPRIDKNLKTENWKTVNVNAFQLSRNVGKSLACFHALTQGIPNLSLNLVELNKY